MPEGVADERLRLARKALLATGFFRSGDVDDEIAPRISELHSYYTQMVERLTRQLEDVDAGRFPSGDPMGVVVVTMRGGQVCRHVGRLVVDGMTEMLVIEEIEPVNYRYDQDGVSFDMLGARRTVRYPLRAIERAEEVVPVDGQVVGQVSCEG
jgi:hypothetical protein